MSVHDEIEVYVVRIYIYIYSLSLSLSLSLSTHATHHQLTLLTLLTLLTYINLLNLQYISMYCVCVCVCVYTGALRAGLRDARSHQRVNVRAQGDKRDGRGNDAPRQHVCRHQDPPGN